MKKTLIIQNAYERVRNPLPLLAFLISLPVLVVFAQSPLDQPSQKQITVGSEIARGFMEMDAASNARHAASALEYSVDLDRVRDQNRSQNTDSDGFLLGAYLGEWMHLYIFLGVVGPTSAFDTAENLHLVKRDLAETFAKMRELQKKLGVNDDALFSAAGFKHSEKIKEMMAKFESGVDLSPERSPSVEASPQSLQPKPDMLTLAQSVSIQLSRGNVVLPAGRDGSSSLCRCRVRNSNLGHRSQMKRGRKFE